MTSRGEGPIPLTTPVGAPQSTGTIFAASGVLGLGSGSPDWQDDRIWHGLLAHLCRLGHPFD